MFLAATMSVAATSCVEPVDDDPANYEWYDEDADKAGGMPAWLAPHSLSVWFSVPGNTWLYKSWLVDVYSDQQTRLGFTATDRQLVVDAPLFIDVLGPKNEELRDVTYDFATGNVTVRFYSSEWGGFNWQTAMRDQMQAVMSEAVAGTRMAAKGYNPSRDSNIGETMAQIASKFLGGSTEGTSMPFDFTKADRLGVQVTLLIKEDKEINESGEDGVRMSAGHYLQIESDNTFRWPEGSNLQAVLNASTTAEYVKALGIEAINVRSYLPDGDDHRYKLPNTGLLVISEGKAVALLQDVTIEGDTLALNKWFLSGEALDAAVTEKALLGLLFGRDPRTAEARATKYGGIVSGLVSDKLEDGLSVAIRRLIYKHRAVVPGIDLPRALRMTPPSN